MGRICILKIIFKMNCFTEEQKKLIVLERGASESSMVVRWSSFKKYSIIGRKKEKYRLQYFGKIIEHFSDIGSVSKKKRDRQISKLYIRSKLFFCGDIFCGHILQNRIKMLRRFKLRYVHNFLVDKKRNWTFSTRFFS